MSIGTVLGGCPCFPVCLLLFNCCSCLYPPQLGDDRPKIAGEARTGRMNLCFLPGLLPMNGSTGPRNGPAAGPCSSPGFPGLTARLRLTPPGNRPILNGLTIRHLRTAFGRCIPTSQRQHETISAGPTTAPAWSSRLLLIKGRRGFDRTATDPTQP